MEKQEWLFWQDLFQNESVLTLSEEKLEEPTTPYYWYHIKDKEPLT